MLRWKTGRRPEADEPVSPPGPVATEELLDQSNVLYRMAYRMTANREHAGDLVQDTYVRLIESKPRFENLPKARAWLVTTLTRLFIDRYRRRVREIKTMESQAAETRYIFSAQDQIALDAMEDFQDDDIREAFHKLDEESRAVVWLFDVEGFNYQEISKALNLPGGTVGSRLHRARKSLRTSLADVARKRGYPG
ncbi:MAG: sigma-70 family RNA polymerase sigma factor [Nitrospirae bacterium]|nr:sigma-70 family RNA polymerase sigma factor [Nitrospirota bacterium]